MGEDVPLYASAYAGFGVREQVRRETYGDDLGQSGWLTADELERFAEWLELGAGSRLLDVGCGSGGPALRLAATTGATVVGVDLLDRGHRDGDAAGERARPRRPGEVRPSRRRRPLPFSDESYDAILSTDAICHLPDRRAMLAEWRRLVAPGGRIVFTDPTIVTGLVTAAEIAARSSIGVYVFSAVAANEQLLAEAGFSSSAARTRPRTWLRWPLVGTTHGRVSATTWSPTKGSRPSRACSASCGRATSSRASGGCRATRTWRRRR